MESVFKVGDRVYHIEYGWGEVVRTNGSFNFPISVRFTDGEENIFSFTNDGRETTESKTQLLSFTEYTLQGFTQERPIVLPEVGELCLVRDFKDSVWKARNFKKFTTHFLDDNGERWDYFKRIKILD
jgi:hypothetical protein